MSNAQLNVLGDFKTNKDVGVQVSLNVVQFKSDDVEVLYAPALELYGYGNTFEEAQQSFQISLAEFLSYTKTKGTFESELQRLGWKTEVVKEQKKFTTPTFSELLISNPRLTDIINNNDIQTHSTNIPLAMA
jgi:hypothetical protein